MNRKSHLFLLLLVLTVFSYLSLNVLLNFTPLRERIVDRLEKNAFRDVRISFLYLNWEFRPTVRSIILERGGPDGSAVNELELGNVQLVLNWSNWWEGKSWNVRNSLRRIQVNHAIVRHRLSSTDSSRSQGTGKALGSSSRTQQLPDVPITVKNWDLILLEDESRAVSITGKNAHYQVRGAPFTTQITRLAGKTSRVDVRVSGMNPLRARARINRLSLPDSIWKLADDRWTGSLEYLGGDTGLLSASLSGTPGVVQGRDLPSAELNARVRRGGEKLLVEELSATSDYLSFNMNGSVSPGGESVDLSANYLVHVKERLNHLLSETNNDYLSVTTSDTLTGTLSVSGPLSEYRVDGQFRLPQSVFELNVGGIQEELRLVDLQGSVNQTGFVLNNGRLVNGGRTFQLERGGIRLEEGALTSDVEGSITEFSLEGETGPIASAFKRVFGSVQSSDVPVGFSGRLTPDAFAGDFVLKDGSVEFDQGPFERIRLLLSYSTRRGSPNLVRGEWIDPMGNDWQLKGDPSGPLNLSAQLDDIDPVVREIPGLRGPYRRDFSPRDLRFEASVPNTEGLFDQYNVRLGFEGGRMEFSDGRTIPLNGAIQLDHETLTLLDASLGDVAQSGLIVRGEARHADGWDSGNWNLNVRSRDFNLSPFFRMADLRTTLTSELEVDGPLRNPSVSGAINNSTLVAGGVELSDLHATVAGRGRQLLIDNVDGRLAGGRLSGSVKSLLRDRFSLDLDLSNFSLPELFPDGSWMNQKTRGRMNLSVKLDGIPGRPETLNGRIRGSSRGIVLDHFPEVADIRDVARPSVFEQDLPIEPFEFDFPVESGVVNVRDFKLNSDDITLKAGGMTHLDGKLSLDMKIVLRGNALRRYLQDVLGNLYRRVGLQAGSKKLTIPLKIKGDIETPVLQIERDKVSNNFRKNLIEDLLTDPIGKPINELIDEIFLLD